MTAERIVGAPYRLGLGGLVSIAAYWNNQGTKGVGFQMSAPPGSDALDQMAANIDEGLHRYRMWNPAPALLLEQLKTYAKCPLVEGQRRVPPGHEIVVILNIAYLEEIGALQPDDFNGMQYIYEIR